MSQQRKDSLYLWVRMVTKHTICNYSGIPLLSTAYKIVFNIFLLRLPPYTEEINGEHHVLFDVTGQEVTVYCIIAMT